MADKAVNGQLTKGYCSEQRLYATRCNHVKPHTLWVPVGESLNDLGKPMIIDNRASASSSSDDPFPFDIESKKVETPKVDPTQSGSIRMLSKETPAKTDGELKPKSR